LDLTTKLSRVSGTPAQPTEHPFTYENTFAREQLTDGSWRIRAGVRDSQSRVVRMLSAELTVPYRILYLLHTSRIDAPIGRYTSAELSAAELDQFLNEFAAFFDGDARHDLWVYSPISHSTIVLDRFNMIYLYGDLERLTVLLSNLGLIEVAAFAAPTAPTPRALHYHPEWDETERRMLAALPWHRSQLRPGDVQWWSGPEAS
jgi:hypothetical protein